MLFNELKIRGSFKLVLFTFLVSALALGAWLAVSSFEPAFVKQILLKVAEQGVAEAEFKLGQSYSNGEGVPKDATKAAEWYTKAAEQGHAEAQFKLGQSYRNGEGVPKEAAKAVEWYTKAAEQGHAKAQYNLGASYSWGEGVPKDAAKAVEWYSKAVEQGFARAQINLGWAYAHGEGVPIDAVKAVEWYTKAAEQGFAIAQILLGQAYASGEDVPIDAVKAVEWYTKAAEQGFAIAQILLGQAYASGEGVPKDDVLAYAWTNLAAGNANKEAVVSRDAYERRLSSLEKAEAQRLSSNWKVGQILAREGNSVSGSASLNLTPGLLVKKTTGKTFLTSKFGQAKAESLNESEKDSQHIARTAILYTSIRYTASLLISYVLFILIARRYSLMKPLAPELRPRWWLGLAVGISMFSAIMMPIVGVQSSDIAGRAIIKTIFFLLYSSIGVLIYFAYKAKIKRESSSDK